jgi:uncharacterized protein YydD (DUF2326 family)
MQNGVSIEVKENQTLSDKFDSLIQAYEEVQKLILTFHEKVDSSRDDILQQEDHKLQALILKSETIKEELNDVKRKIEKLEVIGEVPNSVKAISEKVASVSEEIKEIKKDVLWINDFIRKITIGVSAIVGFVTLIATLIGVGILPMPHWFPTPIIPIKP